MNTVTAIERLREILSEYATGCREQRLLFPTKPWIYISLSIGMIQRNQD